MASVTDPEQRQETLQRSLFRIGLAAPHPRMQLGNHDGRHDDPVRVTVGEGHRLSAAAQEINENVGVDKECFLLSRLAMAASSARWCSVR